MSTMIEVRNLGKRFGNFTAVDDISFTVNSGEVLGFLGPNGAGKSTTMKMITGFLAPGSGSVKVNGHDVVADPIGAKTAIGYLAEGAPAYPDMTPTAFLQFIGRVRGFSGAELNRRVETAMQKAHLQGVAHKNIDTLSKGFKRRVGIAQAILHDPPVLIMDEPTDGLDPNQKHEMRLLISEMARNKAIIVSTHILEEVNALCTRAIIIARGKLLFDGTPAQLEQRSKYHNAITLKGRLPSADDAASALRTLPRVAAVDVIDHQNGQARLMIFPADGAAIISDISQFIRDKGWAVDELIVEAGRLDEVFRTVTATAVAGQEVLT